jgi:hypothetical protein
LFVSFIKLVLSIPMDNDSTPVSSETQPAAPSQINVDRDKNPVWRAEWVIALSAVVVSLATMGLYIYQARIMQSQQLASVWPYIEWTTTFSHADGVDLSVINKGVGPARVKKTKLLLDGKEITDVREMLHILTSGKSDSLSIFGSVVDDRVLASGEEVRLFHMTGKDIDMNKTIAAFKKVEYFVCYCSIYDECWTSQGVKVVPGCMTNN